MCFVSARDVFYNVKQRCMVRKWLSLLLSYEYRCAVWDSIPTGAPPFLFLVYLFSISSFCQAPCAVRNRVPRADVVTSTVVRCCTTYEYVFVSARDVFLLLLLLCVAILLLL